MALKYILKFFFYILTKDKVKVTKSVHFRCHMTIESMELSCTEYQSGSMSLFHIGIPKPSGSNSGAPYAGDLLLSWVTWKPLLNLSHYLEVKTMVPNSSLKSPPYADSKQLPKIIFPYFINNT